MVKAGFFRKFHFAPIYPLRDNGPCTCGCYWVRRAAEKLFAASLKRAPPSKNHPKARRCCWLPQNKPPSNWNGDSWLIRLCAATHDSTFSRSNARSEEHTSELQS